jgi:ribosomal protein L28
MSFADPQSIKIDGVTTSLPRVDSRGRGSTYESGDGLISLEASSQLGSRTRRVIRVNLSKITADPFISTQNVKVSTSCYLVFDIPPAGYTATELKKVYEGFVEALGASSSKLIVQLLGGES